MWAIDLRSTGGNIRAPPPLLIYQLRVTSSYISAAPVLFDTRNAPIPERHPPATRYESSLFPHAPASTLHSLPILFPLLACHNVAKGCCDAPCKVWAQMPALVRGVDLDTTLCAMVQERYHFDAPLVAAKAVFARNNHMIGSPFVTMRQSCAPAVAAMGVAPDTASSTSSTMISKPHAVA